MDNPGSPDTEDPAVSISSHADGATVSGTISVQGTAGDNVGLDKVEVQVDRMIG